jgi:hypothetical protein
VGCFVPISGWVIYMQERGKGQSDRTGCELVAHGKAALEMMTTIMMLEGGLIGCGWVIPAWQGPEGAEG